jgi:hypothetical protein
VVVKDLQVLQVPLEKVVHKVQQDQKAHKVKMGLWVQLAHQVLGVHKVQQVLKAQLEAQAHQVL